MGVLEEWYGMAYNVGNIGVSPCESDYAPKNGKGCFDT